MITSLILKHENVNAQTFNIAFNQNMTAGSALQCAEFFNDGVVSNLTDNTFKSAGVGQINLPPVPAAATVFHVKVSSLNPSGGTIFNNAFPLSILHQQVYFSDTVQQGNA